ncbi:unnamed protein product, partial [Urochloa humidicola]
AAKARRGGGAAVLLLEVGATDRSGRRRAARVGCPAALIPVGSAGALSSPSRCPVWDRAVSLACVRPDLAFMARRPAIGASTAASIRAAAAR